MTVESWMLDLEVGYGGFGDFLAGFEVGRVQGVERAHDRVVEAGGNDLGAVLDRERIVLGVDVVERSLDVQRRVGHGEEALAEF